MPPIPNRPPKPVSRKYNYGVDKFVCPRCEAVHWYDVKKCQGCGRLGPLPIVRPTQGTFDAQGQ